MEKNVVFGSLAGAPSEKYGEDGSLSMMLNLVREDEALRPVMPGTTLMTYPKNMEMLYLHKYNTEKNYVFRVQEGNGCQSVVYLGEEDMPEKGGVIDIQKLHHIHTFEIGNDVKSVTSVGYVLVINTSTGLHYAMMREDEAHGRKFEYMGMLPELPKVEANLDLGVMLYDDVVQLKSDDKEETRRVDGISYKDLVDLKDGAMSHLILSNKQKKDTADIIFAQTNVLRKEIHKLKRFCFPFYVRLAYKLYDGTVFAVTPPLLMIANNSMRPFSYCESATDKNIAFFNTALSSCSLNISCEAVDNRWRDILIGIDVYVTREIVDFADDNNSVQSLVSLVNNSAYQLNSFMVGRKAPSTQRNEENILSYITNNHKYLSEIGRYKQLDRFSKTPSGIKYDCRYLIEKDYFRGGRAELEVRMNHIGGQGDTLYARSDAEAKEWADSIGLSIENYYVFDLIDKGYNVAILISVKSIPATKILYKSNGDGDVSVMAWANMENPDGKSGLDDVKNSSVFFKLASVSFAEYGYEGFSISMDDITDSSTLENLTNQEQLHSDTVDGYRFITDTTKVTNNRLCVIVKEQEFPHPHLQISTDPGIIESAGEILGSWIKIVENGKVYYRQTDLDYSSLSQLRYVYYPFSSAASLIAYRRDSSASQRGKFAYYVEEIALSKHSTLAGVYAYNDYKSLHELANVIAGSRVDFSENVPEDVRMLVEIMNSSPQSRYVGNKIYQSEVNNPFAFLNRTTSTLNCSKIMAIETLSTPLSTGQFGDFQLVAFTDNGLWAVKTDETGAIMGAKDVISDDVLLNGTSVSNVDGSLIYATNRGIMQLVGSKAECISDHLRIVGKKDVKPSQLDGIADSVEAKDVRDFVAEEGFCVLRDNRNQQLIFLNKHDEWCYVYSMIGGSWGVMERGGLEKSINSYPECWAEASNGGCRSIVKMDERQTGNRDVFLLTRAIKSSEAGVLKTLRKLIMRGEFTGGAIRMGVWGSNDARKWVLIASSSSEYLRAISGTPMKYMKVAAWGTVEDYDCLSGMSMELEPRRGENGVE